MSKPDRGSHDAEIPEEPGELTPAALEVIRRAAFELRVTDPQEAVRTLRRIVSKGGAAAALARGALAEIYFEELGDFDGAEAEFRALLKEAPGLPAAELGLARVLRETGQLGEADEGLLRAQGGLSANLLKLVEADARGDSLAEGAEGAGEELLLLLEVALELTELRAARPGAAEVTVDERLLDFAESARLFDEPDEDEEAVQAEPQWSDWTRFYERVARLFAVLAPPRALERLRAAETTGLVHPSVSARLQSLLLEEVGDLHSALLEARRHLKLEEEAGRFPAEDEVLHAAGLVQTLGDETGARAILASQLVRLEQALARPAVTAASDDEVGARASADDTELRASLAETAQALRELLGPERLIGLGRRRPG